MIQMQYSKSILLQIKIEKETMIFSIEEAKETILDFSQGTVKVL